MRRHSDPPLPRSPPTLQSPSILPRVLLFFFITAFVGRQTAVGVVTGKEDAITSSANGIREVAPSKQSSFSPESFYFPQSPSTPPRVFLFFFTTAFVGHKTAWDVVTDQGDAITSSVQGYFAHKNPPPRRILQ